jgi:hypothetical protein
MPVRREMQRWPVAGLFGLLVVLGAQTYANEETVEARMRRDVTFLASPECEGRGIETEGINRAAEYIAAHFAKAGLKPGGANGSYYQPFTVLGSNKMVGPNVLKLRGPQGQEILLRQGADFEVLGVSGGGKVTAPVVFVGFGVTAKEIGYDDYQGVDVAGKVVVYLRYTPRAGNKNVPFDGGRQDQHASLPHKQSLAEANKAAAVILVNDHSEVEGGDKLTPFSYLAGFNPGGTIPAFHVKRTVFDPIFRSAFGEGLYQTEEAINRELKPRSAPLAGWTATLEAKVQRKTIPVKNVIAVAEGAGPLAKETVVIGAHYDHLGYGGRGSRAKEQGGKQIHHGADDNASGTTAMLELVRRFSAQPDRQGRRRLVFMAFSAEETGLLGSQHYCNKEPLFPLDQTVAMVNLDMVGRLRPDKDSKKDKLIVEGTGTAKTFDSLIEKLNVDTGFQLVKKAGGTGPSDHDSFYRKKVPVIFFWTGVHEDYHKPSDTAEKINVSGMRRITDLAEKVVSHLAATSERPEYVYIASKMSPTAGKGPRLGIMPNYESEKEGVIVGDVSAGGPAAKGGVKAGDRIVEISGKAVTNINTYMVIMAQQRGGQTIDVGVIRDGKRITLKVTLQ